MKVTDKTLILRIFREPILLICVDKYITSFLCLSTYYWILKLNIENINILVFWHLFHCHGLKRWYLSRPSPTPVHILACSQIETLRTISAVQIRYFLSTLAWQMFFVFVWFLQHFCSFAFHRDTGLRRRLRLAPSYLFIPYTPRTYIYIHYHIKMLLDRRLLLWFIYYKLEPFCEGYL